MNYEELRDFISARMRMSHVYQPVMIRTLLASKGRAGVTDIARALLENPLAFVIRDGYQVTKDHLLVIPRRHVADYFELGRAESRARDSLVRRARKPLSEWDASLAGANVGINCGEAAGQTVMHCHLHVIPRRAGDTPNPRGGVRAVVPGGAPYTQAGA